MVVEEIPKEIPETNDPKEAEKEEDSKTFTFESILFIMTKKLKTVYTFLTQLNSFKSN